MDSRQSEALVRPADSASNLRTISPHSPLNLPNFLETGRVTVSFQRRSRMLFRPGSVMSGGNHSVADPDGATSSKKNGSRNET